ncbi:Mu transposase C-terminal domain-containing protein [Caminibacter mediatlanticus]|uniref:Integrase, catalytic region n=1 Tax=Caminibacter mediatlanticus TB-2 TaxID=391592 RepID=A0AAI9F2G6_9BACT|nr:Mu transposase C-terminal domain-containing protein [Caminibacter mediatlanticus]EDM23571.1 Integrase, catalytic region [Caminibacter mediatlanticus TB-2]
MIEIKIGNIITYQNKQYQIINILPPDNLIIKDTKENIKTIKISEIDDNLHSTEIPPDIDHIDEKLYQEAKKRYEIIKPVLEGKIISKKDKEKLAKQHNINITTLYDWINKYKTTNTILSLIPQYNQRGGKGKSRLPKEIEIIVDTLIKERYLSRQKISISKLHKEINAILQSKNLKTIAYNTLRNRINQLDERKAFKIREGNTAYNNKIRPAGKNFEAQYPLHIVQIDHTELDIQIVDETYRKPIGKPQITAAIDVYSRMIYGFYLSLDKPSFYSVGQTLYLGFSPKDKYLKELNIDSKWEIYGVPNTIHLDNAAEFRGEQLRKVCEIFGINIDFRPKGSPNYGGHIERFLKTLNLELHSLKGTTFSNPQIRRDYNSEKKAIFTLKELEKYIVKWIVDYYHNKPHEGLKGKTPKERFFEGIMGTDNNLPTPLKILSPKELELARISLLPYEERTIQRTGVSLFGITYYDECLIPFMKPTPQNKQKEKYIFRYDPKDMSRIYFYHPELNEYIEIPYKNLHNPKTSLWELNIAKEYLKSKKIKNYNETKLFETILELRKLEEESANKTKLHRRRKENKKVSKPLSKDIEKKEETKYSLENDDIEIFELDFKSNKKDKK